MRGTAAVSALAGPVARRAARTRRAAATHAALLATAERLFAEHGVAEVSGRQVAEAAGQANNSAVAYHIGTKTDLVRAIVAAHTEPMDRLRTAMIERTAASTDLRDHLACLVLPLTGHLAELGVPSWYARFLAQVSTDPHLYAQALDDTTSATPIARATALLLDADLPAPVVALRAQMARHAILHTCAERERSLAAGTGTPVASWDETGAALVDGLAGLLGAPVRA